MLCVRVCVCAVFVCMLSGARDRALFVRLHSPIALVCAFVILLRRRPIERWWWRQPRWLQPPPRVERVKENRRCCVMSNSGGTTHKLASCGSVCENRHLVAAVDAHHKRNI